MPVSKLPHAFSSSMRHNALALYSFAVLICAACILLGGAAQAVAAQESSANSVHVESLASMGGSAAAYAAEGDYLFVGQGAGIAVFDVSVPNNPVEIAHYGPLDGAVQHIAVQDHILYAALGESGLAIIDAATPTAMKTLARYPAHRATYVAVDGKRVYLADNEDRLLRLVDVRKPAAPTLLGTFAPNASVRAMSVAGNRVFLSLSTYGLQIVDVTDPASPKSVAHHTSLMTSQAVEFVGGYAIVIEWDSDARIYDFSNPAVLKKLAVLDRVNALDVRASYAYALGWDGLTVWDLSDPANPVQLLVRQGSVADGERIFVTKNRAFIIDSSDDIVVFDLSQPTVPLEVGSLSMAASEARLASMDGSRLVAASGSKLTAYDLAELGNTVQDAPYSLSGQAMALTVCGQWAFVAVDGGKLGLEIVHIEAAGELKRIGFLATDAAIRKLFCSGAYVYAQQSDRFLVIDVSNPAKPRQVGSYAVPAGVRAMAIDPPRAYVADEADALHIVDISGSPPGAAQPRLLGTYSDPQSYVRIHTLAAGDGHVYLGRGDQIDVVDVSDAAHPRKLGSLTPHPSAMSALFYQASHLLAYYEGSYYSGAALHFVNVTDPAHPVETAVFEPTFYGADLAASNGYIAFADDENGLAVYWWSPAVTASFAATGPVDFSPTASVTYRVDAAGLLPAGSTAAARTVNLEHFRPYLPQRGQAGPLDEVVAPFTLQATDAASGKALVPSTSLKITVRLSADQLEAIDPQSIALYAWTGTAWAQLPSSRFDPTSGVLTASAPQFAPWGVRAASRTPGTAVFLPYVAQPGPDVALNAFEVTQSTQSLSNSVPLVAGKAALARVYATTNGAEPARDVYLNLSATRDGVALPGSPIQVGPWAVFPAWDRGVYGTSFNVPLPLDWTHGSVTLTADLRRGDGVKDGDPTNNRRTLSAQFLNVPALDLMIVPVNYVHEPSGQVYPPPAQEKITDWIARIYPIPGIRVSYHAPVTFRGDLTQYNDFSRLLRQITDLRTSEKAPRGRAYYGMFTMPPVTGSYIAGVGWLGSPRASVGINSGETAGHELGHNFGRLHSPCGDPGSIDPNYPYPEASLGEYGFDSGSYTIWTPAAGKDFMSYCHPRWTSDYTYLALLADQLKHGATSAAALESRVLWVRAVLYEDGSAEFLPPYNLTGAPDAAPADAACRIRLLGDGDRVLAHHPVQMAEAADGEPVRYASVMLPLPPEPVQAMALVCGGQEAARAGIPAVVVTASTPQVRQEDGELVLEWDATGGPALVQFRRQSDPGWTTLSVDLTDGVMVIDVDAMPGETLQFRVVYAGHGETAVEAAAATAAVDLPDKPPRVWITGPSAAPAGASVVLFGHGFDVEDGVLDGLTWFVNGAPAGNGDQLQITAPASGNVEVTLSTVDKAGQSSVAVHRVEVGTGQ